MLTQNKKEANIMKKFFLWAGAISLIAGSIYYAWLIRVEQQVQDNYQVAVEKQVKHPKIITIKNNFGLEHLVSLGNKKSGKATFMNRLKGYRNSSTPIVMIFTDLYHNKTSLMLAKNWKRYNTMSIELPPSTYLVDIYSPLNSDHSFYNTANGKVIKVSNGKESLYTLSYQRFKNPDYDTLRDELECIKQNKSNLTDTSMTYKDLKDSFIYWLRHYHKLSYGDRVKLIRIL